MEGFIEDITERKQAEAAIHRQNEILDALQQTTLDLLSELDLDVLLENIVRRAGALMGTSAGYLDLLDPETGQLRPRVGMGALAESLDHPVQPGQGVAGTVWQSGKPLIVEDYDRWPGRIGSFSRKMIRSIVGVPLLSSGQVLGVLGLAHEAFSEKVFTPGDVDVLTEFARLVTIGIENARLYRAAQQELAERKRAEEIVRLRLRLWEYATTHSVDELMQKALDEIGALTGSPIGFYHFVEEDQITLSLQAWSTRTLTEFCRAEGKGLHYPIDEAGVWVDCVHQRKPVIHNDYSALPHRRGMPAGHAEVIRELVAPTIRHNRVVAILGIGNKPTDYDEKDVELVSYIADIIWTIMEQKRANEQILQLNARLEQLAMTDELTGLFNRRSFFKRGKEEIRRSRRYHTPLSLLMIDIDNFKAVNDTYGHDAGDRMLRCVADTLQHSIRDIDLLARLGGEEFGILLPNTEAADAVKLAERLRLAVAQATCSLLEHQAGVTLSIGVTTYDQDIENIDHLLKDADTAMYRAKNLGRNQVVYAG
jgi:diguanylate cyclase (GGDEF)-like protein